MTGIYIVSYLLQAGVAYVFKALLWRKQITVQMRTLTMAVTLHKSILWSSLVIILTFVWNTWKHHLRMDLFYLTFPENSLLFQRCGNRNIEYLITFFLARQVMNECKWSARVFFSTKSEYNNRFLNLVWDFFLHQFV